MLFSVIAYDLILYVSDWKQKENPIVLENSNPQGLGAIVRNVYNVSAFERQLDEVE